MNTGPLYQGGGTLMGMNIRTSPYAVTRSKKVELVRHPIRKRRRNWAVKVTWLETPAVFKLGDGTLVCHPSIYQKLVREFAPKETQ